MWPAWCSNHVIYKGRKIVGQCLVSPGASLPHVVYFLILLLFLLQYEYDHDVKGDRVVLGKGTYGIDLSLTLTDYWGCGQHVLNSSLSFIRQGVNYTVMLLILVEPQILLCASRPPPNISWSLETESQACPFCIWPFGGASYGWAGVVIADWSKWT